MAPNQRSAPEQILSTLDADPALIEHYDPNEVEAIPLAAVQARLIELGLTPTMPPELQRIFVKSTPSPAADVLRVLVDDAEYLQPQSVEIRPLAEVTACLQRQGINYRAGVAAIIDLVGEHSSDSVDAAKDQSKVRSIKSARLRRRRSLFLATIGSAAAATAAVAATVGFFVAREALQDKVIADQRYEIQELRSQVQGLNAKSTELKDGADDLVALTMGVPPGGPVGHDSRMAFLDGARSPDNIAPPIGVGVPLQIVPEANPGGSGLRAWAPALRAGDLEVAQRSLEDGARDGDVMAAWKLGRMYADGDGVPQDDLRAFEYFGSIANSHADEATGTAEARFVANAFVALGSYYLTGIPGSSIKPDPARAHEMFNYAATYFGDPDAQYHLGRMLVEDQGVPKDPKSGARWLSLAASKGQHQAQAVFGTMLFNGQYVPRDGARGLMWLTLAKDAAAPKETWIADLYAAAMKQATEQERGVALVYLEHWMENSRGGRRE
jgi:exopolysaccharide production negative regulator